MINVIEVFECVCECGHRWIAEEMPKRCAKCKRRAWNKTAVLVGSPKPETVRLPEVESVIPERVRVESAKAEVLAVPKPAVLSTFSHDYDNCRTYGCLLCKERKKK